MEEHPAVHAASNSAVHAQTGEMERSQVEVHGEGQSETEHGGAEGTKKPQSQKKASSFKYIKEEKLAILQVLLEIGAELWEMEKAINKPWRMLYWEQRVALPIREQLRNNYRYVDVGFDIDQRFGSAAGIENLRKWVRSQRTQETERVEAERTRVPGSPQGRPLSEVQRLRAKVFAEVIQAERSEKNGEALLGVSQGEGGTPTEGTSLPGTVSGPAPASGGHIREPSLEPLTTLFSPSNGRTDVSSTMYVTGGAGVGVYSNSAFGDGGGAPAPVVSVATSISGTAPASGASIDVESTSEAARHQIYVTNNGKGPVLAPRPAGMDAHRSTQDSRAGTAVNAESSGIFGSPVVSSPVSGGGGGGGGPGAAEIRSASTGGARRRSISESTPEDFRRGEGLPSKKKKAKADHSEVVGKVMVQVNNLNLPVDALELLAESLSTEISEARGLAGITTPYAGPSGGRAGAGAGGMSVQERQLMLEEKVQASREAEAAQTLAERRLKLMEEMRAAGNQHVVTEEVLQKQRLVVLGLAPPLLPRRGGGL